jgi:hypothetical protein
MKTKNKKLPLKYKVDWTSHGIARTLPAKNGFIKETGWTIEGPIHQDYFEWINEFEATHPKHGRVKGDFEQCVQASSKKAYEQFLKDHPYDEWNYMDI